MMDETVLADVRRARRVVVLTGAGISAESGVPTFRGAGGLWRTFRPEDLATPAAFTRDPAVVWSWYRWRQRLVAAATPNDGHRALAALESRVPSFQLVTQNVDGLHQRAGSSHVIELHGSLWRLACSDGCGRVERTEERPVAAEHDALPRCACGAWQRPGVVWFGEALPEAGLREACSAAADCDVLIAVGTSSVVYPAAALPALAHRSGAVVIEINVEPTPLTPLAHAVVRAPAALALPWLEQCW